MSMSVPYGHLSSVIAWQSNRFGDAKAMKMGGSIAGLVDEHKRTPTYATRPEGLSFRTLTSNGQVSACTPGPAAAVEACVLPSSFVVSVTLNSCCQSFAMAYTAAEPAQLQPLPGAVKHAGGADVADQQQPRDVAGGCQAAFLQRPAAQGCLRDALAVDGPADSCTMRPGPAGALFNTVLGLAPSPTPSCARLPQRRTRSGWTCRFVCDAPRTCRCAFQHCAWPCTFSNAQLRKAASETHSQWMDLQIRVRCAQDLQVRYSTACLALHQARHFARTALSCGCLQGWLAGKYPCCLGCNVIHTLEPCGSSAKPTTPPSPIGSV